MSAIAIYPGTFDPITKGHLDVAERGAHIFDRVIIAVAQNEKKHPLFNQEERIRLIEENIQGHDRISVMGFDGLTVELAKKMKAQAIIRGLRAISDFEHEFQMAQMNRQLDEDIETIFLMPNQELFYTSSSIVKQVCAFTDKHMEKFAPQNVIEAIKAKF